jgi:hypothetical protein
VAKRAAEAFALLFGSEVRRELAIELAIGDRVGRYRPIHGGGDRDEYGR